MKQISLPQLAMIIGNFILTGTLISLPQALVQTAEQNTWMVPFLGMPFLLFIIFIGFGKKDKINKWKDIFSLEKGLTKTQKVFVAIMLIFLTLLFIRDIRSMADFVVASLLPKTPIEILTILTALTVVYICYAGIEVIARITVIHFIVLGGILLLLPFMLLNEFKLENVEPVFGMGATYSLAKSSFLSSAWLGELVVIFFLVPYVDPIKGIKKAGVIGSVLGVFFLFLLIFLELTVLGADIVKVSTFPNYQLIQEIRITDFLDRLDLVIVTVWVPTFICRIALIMYCINKCFGLLKGSETNLYVPNALLLSVLAITLFKNNVQHLEFSFFTWAILGLGLELMLLMLFFIIRAKATYLDK